MTQQTPMPEPRQPVSEPAMPQQQTPQRPQPVRQSPAHGAPVPPASAPGVPPVAQRPARPAGPKQIATLPPLQVLLDQTPESPRTGEPTRPALITIAMAIFFLAAAATAASYAVHWWAAVTPETYPASARLIEWVTPEPGKWLALTLEGVLAITVALVAGVSGAAGFQAWNGWRWSKWAGVAAALLGGVVALLINWVGFIALGLAAAGAVLLFMPPATEFFHRFDIHRGKRPDAYRRPRHVFYGRLPRYR